jgi:hypothetical protein
MPVQEIKNHNEEALIPKKRLRNDISDDEISSE